VVVQQVELAQVGAALHPIMFMVVTVRPVRVVVAHLRPLRPVVVDLHLLLPLILAEWARPRQAQPVWPVAQVQQPVQSKQ
jgi:hypothetical protein